MERIANAVTDCVRMAYGLTYVAVYMLLVLAFYVAVGLGVGVVIYAAFDWVVGSLF